MSIANKHTQRYYHHSIIVITRLNWYKYFFINRLFPFIRRTFNFCCFRIKTERIFFQSHQILCEYSLRTNQNNCCLYLNWKLAHILAVQDRYNWISTLTQTDLFDFIAMIQTIKHVFRSVSNANCQIQIQVQVSTTVSKCTVNNRFFVMRKLEISKIKSFNKFTTPFISE